MNLLLCYLLAEALVKRLSDKKKAKEEDAQKIMKEMQDNKLECMNSRYEADQTATKKPGDKTGKPESSSCDAYQKKQDAAVKATKGSTMSIEIYSVQ